MDAFINTKVLSGLISDIDTCRTKLEHCITTVKAEFKVADALLAGEQFETFRNEAIAACNSITSTIDGLLRAKAFLNELEPEIVNYDSTRY